MQTAITDYEVIKPEESQTRIGLTYQDLIELWAQWLVSDSPDANNYSNVVFLRGVGFPESSRTQAIVYNQQLWLDLAHLVSLTINSYFFL